MAFLPRGEGEQLTVLAAGIRGGQFPPGPLFDPFAEEVVVSPRDRDDLEAFARAGWRFLGRSDLPWHDIQEVNAERLEPGLLADSPAGLVIVRDRLVVSFRSHGHAMEFLGRYDEPRRLGWGEHLYEVRLRLPERDLLHAIEVELRFLLAQAGHGDSPVRYAEASLLYRLRHPGTLTQVDPVAQWQWDFIKLANAWAAANTLGKDPKGRPVLVGVLDLGFHRKEIEIQGKVAWSTYLGSDGKVDTTQFPKNAHGTFCAGLIGAEADGLGVSGAAPECELALVALHPDGVISQVGLGEAIRLCTDGVNDRPVDVISVSLASCRASWPREKHLEDAIDHAHSKGRLDATGAALGVTIVWATVNTDEEILSDSVTGHDPLVVVAQCDDQGAKVTSGFGSGLDLLAPGDGVVGIVWKGTTTIDKEYGSSAAAPCVAGVAALILARRPELRWDQVAKALTESCDPQSTTKVHSASVGWGSLNAWEAVKLADTL